MEHVTYDERNADDLFKIPLSIPKYQRIYTWRYDQVKTLLDDVFNIKNLNKYFVGAIILHKHVKGDKEVCDIVDGQQRIVTIALIKYALLDSPELIPEELLQFFNCEFASQEAQINIVNNLFSIRQYLSDPQRKNAIKSNLPKLYFSILTIDQADNLDLAFTFFSNTNSKGIKLTDYDLLKPHHLRYISSDLEEQQMHLASKWDDMINKARNVSKETVANNDEREYVTYIRLIEFMLFRLRNWQRMGDVNESVEFHIKKEFEAAPIINEIPPFGEQFKFCEPIQGGQHFFAYVDHFIDEYNKFGLKDEYGNYGLKALIQDTFGKNGSNSWYGTVIEALVFCYFLKFGNNYINEATLSIIRFISIIRFRLGRAYKPTIIEWARSSKIVMEINNATSPTFFLAAIENRIDFVLRNDGEDGKPEQAKNGVRWRYLEYCCKPISLELMTKTKVNYYKNYYLDRYGKFC